MGVRKTTDFLEKATWTLAGALLVLCIVAGLIIPAGDTAATSRIQQHVENSVDPAALPKFPGTAPAEGTQNQAPALPAPEVPAE